MPSEDYKNFQSQEKAKILACSVIESQFLDFPLSWMFCVKTDM